MPAFFVNVLSVIKMVKRVCAFFHYGLNHELYRYVWIITFWVFSWQNRRNIEFAPTHIQWYNQTCDKQRKRNWTKTNIRKQCYGREIKEEKEMIKEDKRRQPQNQAFCVHSYESKYKLNSNSKFRNRRTKAYEKHLFNEYCKRHSKYKASTSTLHVLILRWIPNLWHSAHNLIFCTWLYLLQHN